MVVMIPSISEAYALSQYDIVLKRLKQSIFITLGYGIPAVWIMFQFAGPLTHLFFHSPEAQYYLQLLWPYFLSSVCHAAAGMLNRNGLCERGFLSQCVEPYRCAEYDVCNGVNGESANARDYPRDEHWHDSFDEPALCHDLQSAASICIAYGREQSAAN